MFTVLFCLYICICVIKNIWKIHSFSRNYDRNLEHKNQSLLIYYLSTQKPGMICVDNDVKFIFLRQYNNLAPCTHSLKKKPLPYNSFSVVCFDLFIFISIIHSKIHSRILCTCYNLNENKEAKTSSTVKMLQLSKIISSPFALTDNWVYKTFPINKLIKHSGNIKR